MPQLGPYFGDVELAMDCIEKLERRDRNADYRKNGNVDFDNALNTRIPRSLANARSIDAATTWAESLDDKDKQLQACAVLLDIATKHIGIASSSKRTPMPKNFPRETLSTQGCTDNLGNFPLVRARSVFGVCLLNGE